MVERPSVGPPSAGFRRRVDSGTTPRSDCAPQTDGGNVSIPKEQQSRCETAFLFLGAANLAMMELVLILANREKREIPRTIANRISADRYTDCDSVDAIYILIARVATFPSAVYMDGRLLVRSLPYDDGSFSDPGSKWPTQFSREIRKSG